MNSKHSLFYKAFVGITAMLLIVCLIIFIAIFTFFPMAYSKTMEYQNSFITSEFVHSLNELESKDEIESGSITMIKISM